MKTDIFDLYKLMERDYVLLAFKGSITSELLSSVFQIMESKMEDLQDSPKIRKRVFNVLVECLQNLYHHIDEFEIVGSPEELAEKKSAIFSISRTPESYDIVTGNYIDQANVKDISQKIEYINSLDKDELKAYYKEVLNNGVLSKKGGGGLGLIDIARRSGSKLDYNIREISDSFSFFTLTVKILKK